MGLYFRHKSSLEHDTGPHPECGDRIRAIEAALDAAGWPGLELSDAPEASIEQLERVHSSRHVAEIERICATGGGAIDADTVAVEASWEAARRAAGAAAEAGERLLAGEDRFAFCGLRPPGHHAEVDRAMGFCLFNNAAVAASNAIAVAGAERVLILDWDVHHGNGTAEIFYPSDAVLFASIHQHPLYPGTGHPNETGSGSGRGYTLNMPVAPGSGGSEFLSLVGHVVAPVAREFRPDLIVVSAGYDAHVDDPLANCNLDDNDYADLSATIRELGAELGAPVLVCLEGGYALEALASSTLATVRAFGDTLPPPEAPPQPAAAARRHFARDWDVLAAS